MTAPKRFTWVFIVISILYLQSSTFLFASTQSPHKQTSYDIHILTDDELSESDSDSSSGKRSPSPEPSPVLLPESIGKSQYQIVFPFAYGKTNLAVNSHADYQLNPENLRFLIYQHYFSIFDVKAKTPILTVHRINPSDVRKSKKVKRPRRFSSDLRLLPENNVLHRDYRNVHGPYSRGHLTPNGDFNSKDLSVKTFMTSNTAPQVQKSFNDGVWNKLEQCVRYWVEKRARPFTILTGVIHENPDHSKFLNNTVQIPKYFYKIIIDENHSPRPKILSFKMENRNYSKKEYHLDNYLVDIETLQEDTGLLFLQEIDDETREHLMAKKHKSWSCPY